MPKRSIDNFPRLAFAQEGPFFSKADVDGILAEVNIPLPRSRIAMESPIARTGDTERRKIGRRAALQIRLERAAELRAYNDVLQRAPTPLMLEKRYARAERAALDLLNALGAGPSGQFSKVPVPIQNGLMTAAAEKAKRRGEPRSYIVQETLSGVIQLRRWSTRLKEGAHGKAQQAAAPNVGDAALGAWIANLAAIFRDIWNRDKVGVSENPYTHKPGGPFFRFVRASSQRLGMSFEDQALKKRIQRALT